MWINDKVKYTPEVVTISKGEPIEATVVSVGTEDKVTIRLPDGALERVERRLCEKV